jgi:hypothetical protein
MGGSVHERQHSFFGDEEEIAIREYRATSAMIPGNSLKGEIFRDLAAQASVEKIERE